MPPDTLEAAAAGAVAAATPTTTTTAPTEAASPAASGASGASGATGTAAGATNAGAGATAAGTVPETYDLKVPDGAKLDADIVTRTADIARALGLSNDAGQQLLDAQIAEIQKATGAAIDAAKAEQLQAMQPGGAIWTEQEAAWRTSALADKEIGGSPEKLTASAELATRVVNRFATDEAKDFFQKSGLGSHPELVRIFARIGRQMSEATLALPGTSTGGAQTEQERLAKRYPTMVAKS